MVQYRQHVTEIEQRIPVYVAYVLLQRQDILDQRGDRGSRQGITHRDVDTPDLLRLSTSPEIISSLVKEITENNKIYISHTELGKTPLLFCNAKIYSINEATGVPAKG